MTKSSANLNEQQKSWNFLATLFYIACLVGLAYLFHLKGVTKEDFKAGDIALLSIATYRLTRILVFDKIFKFFRDFLKSKEKLYVFFVIREIITCPWCAGVWVTLTIIVFYYLVPFGDLLVYVLALAGIASIVILYSNMLHMRTERKQRIHQKQKSSIDDYN